MLEVSRATKPEELKKVINLVNKVFMAPRNYPQIMEKHFPHLFSTNNLENLRIIMKDGKPISHVGIWEGKLLIHGSWFKIGMIGAVCTHPDYRKKGYASVILKDAFSKLKKDKVDFVLVSGARNLYKRIGCVEAGNVYLYKISKGKLKIRENNLKIKVYERGNIDNLIKIYQNEPVRYLRNYEEFKLLAERRFHSKYIKNNIYLVFLRNCPLAYIAAGSINKGVLEINEYAGSRQGVLYLIQNIFKIIKAKAVTITVPFQDIELRSKLKAQGVKSSLSYPTAAMFIVNPRSFFEKLQPYLGERIGSKILSKYKIELVKGHIKLTINKQIMKFNDIPELTLFFFGVPDKLDDPSQAKLKIRKNNILKNALPLPTPVYGLNFV